MSGGPVPGLKLKPPDMQMRGQICWHFTTKDHKGGEKEVLKRSALSDKRVERFNT